MKRFATALTAQRIAPVSEIKDPKEREWFEKFGLTTNLVTAAAPLVISAHSADEANQMAISQSTQFLIKDGWYNHKACSIEIPEPVTPNDEPVTPNDEPVTPNDEPVTPNDEPVTPNDEPVTPTR